MRSSTSNVLLSVLLPLTAHAQQPAADGIIVPFTSGLPACASDCGPLYDAQGACTPPVLSATSSSCFCAYGTLQPFVTGNDTTICPNACTTDPTGLAAIRDWFLDYCGQGNLISTSTSSTSTATATNNIENITNDTVDQATTTGSTNNSWIHTHYRWVIMLVFLFFGITFSWIGACLLRRRYARKKEKEIAMRPPVAWGPHQLQGMTGGYRYGDGIVDVGRNTRARGVAAAGSTIDVTVTPPDATLEKMEDGKGNWLRKSRR